MRGASRIAAVVVAAALVCAVGCSDEGGGAAPGSGGSKPDATHLGKAVDKAVRSGKVDSKTLERAALKDAQTAGTMLPAKDLLAMATAKARELDPDVILIMAKYSWGDRELSFRRAEFGFNSPKLKAQGDRGGTTWSVYVRDGKVDKVRRSTHLWRPEAKLEPLPQAAFAAASRAGLEAWWAKNPKAKLFMSLTPISGASPGKGGWLWRAMLSGPGVPEDFKLKLDGESLAPLPGK